jgi:putative ATP-binding cassette transporter
MKADRLTKSETAASAEPPVRAKNTIWRDAGYLFSLIGGYLRADPLIGSILIIIVLAGGMASGALAVGATIEIGHVLDALVKQNASLGSTTLINTLLLLLALMCVQATTYGARYIYRIRWRTVFTRQFLMQWMESNRFYHFQRQQHVDNPEQRIQEDLFLVAEQTSELLPTMLTVFTTLSLSVVVLWRLSAPLALDMLGIRFRIPADLLTSAIVVGIFWTIGAHYVGRAITRIEVARQRLEADFRHGLAQVREHGEAVAFERGGFREEQRAIERFDLIRTNWRHYTIAQIRLLIFNLMTGSIVPRLLPIMLSAPRVLNGQMTIGELTIVTQTFGQVLSGMTFFAAYYSQIATLRASVARVRLFQDELAKPITSEIVVAERAGSIALRDVRVDLSDGQHLLTIKEIDIGKGDRILVRGRSGAGKSTMLRAIAGLWPHGSGTVTRPALPTMMFLPQRSYMPDGPLSDLLTFPELSKADDRQRYIEVLNTLSLGAYATRLDEIGEWRRILSPGEQQRVAAARALLRMPDFLFLDEATSSLDVELEADVYRALINALPDAAIISVAHRPTVARYHKIIIEVGADENAGTGSVAAHATELKEQSND